MSLQIWVKDTVEEWLTVPQTQRENLIKSVELLNSHSLDHSLNFLLR